MFFLLMLSRRWWQEMKIIDESKNNKYTRAMKALENVLIQNDMTIEAMCDGIIVRIDDKEFRLYEKENAHYVGTLPRMFDTECFVLEEQNDANNSNRFS